MLSLWNQFKSDSTSDSQLTSKKYLDKLLFDPFEVIFDEIFNSSSLGIDFIKNDDKSLLISVDLPGVKEENINIELLKDNTINIRCEKKTNKSSHSIFKSFRIPSGYDANSITTSLKDGVLEFMLQPKQLEDKEVKKIPINTSK